MPVSMGLTSTWGAQEWGPTLIEALTAEAVLLRSGAQRIDTTGRVVNVPRIKVNPRAAWARELEAIASDAGDSDTLVLTPRKVANLVHLSNESVMDSPVNQLDAVGRALIKGVATVVDAAAFSATASEALTPAGLLTTRELPTTRIRAALTIRQIFEAVGTITAAGGRPNACVLSAADATSIRLEAISAGYLLTQDPTQPGVDQIAGCRLLVAPSFRSREALIYDSNYLVVAIRKDATVDFSPDDGFASDSTTARIVMRIDFAVADKNAFYWWQYEA